MKNLTEHLFLRALVERVTEGTSNIHIEGNFDQMYAARRVVRVTRSLKEALESGKSLDEVKLIIAEKHEAAREFYEKTGFIWPLLRRMTLV